MKDVQEGPVVWEGEGGEGRLHVFGALQDEASLSAWVGENQVRSATHDAFAGDIEEVRRQAAFEVVGSVNWKTMSISDRQLVAS